MKHFLGVKKIGHGGTLDPLATGLLIIGINQKTKTLNQFLLENKKYQAIIELNKKTTTADAEGKLITTQDVVINLAQLTNVINYFNGLEYYQTPHQFSAVKVNGKKLYQYARTEKSVIITPRKVKIFQLKLIAFNFPYIEIELEVSKGFYVRSFAEDLATKLNTVAYLKKLVRTKCHNFVLTDETLDVMKLKKSLKKENT
ncbi:tRNA pseudouridine(55) synthase TruB [[Mycoplasma] cavipharyngis]|uniref:tRNA pseudouridine(55) synthase TruB n=1 Tax=[Mycoplasma] cavipharyngis TaxID=92757 RepID=UPI003703DEC0